MLAILTVELTKKLKTDCTIACTGGVEMYTFIHELPELTFLPLSNQSNNSY